MDIIARFISIELIKLAMKNNNKSSNTKQYLDLVPRLLETLKDSLIKDKDFLEESVKLNHPHRELIDVLNNQKEPLINQIRVVISSLFPEIEND
ncbi:MAG: hypothetical protein AAFQ87_23540, partial [Bacteroidota bacterium]